MKVTRKNLKIITYTMVNNSVLNVNLETQTAPKIRESSSKEWVEYGTEDFANAYPQFLIDLYYNSSTHAAIINATSEMIAGEDLEVKEDESQNLETYVALKKFMANANSNETLHEVVKKIAFDFKLQGGYALNIVWSKDKKSIAEIFHIPVERVRAGRPDDTGIVTEYWISSDWTNAREHEPKEVPAFNPNKITTPNQILYTGRYSPNMDIYYVPDYVGGCNWALIDQNIAEFHLNNIQNGFAGSYFISFANGVPTQEERFAIEKSLAEKFTGTQASGRFVLTFSEDKSRVPEITPIAMTNADKQYLALQELMTQNILVSHRVTSPMLMGIKNDTGLGSNADELNSAFEVYLNTVVMPYQIHILKTLNKILDINQMNVPLTFVQAKPVTSRFTIDDMRTVMTADEIREELGLEALESNEIVTDGVDEIVSPEKIEAKLTGQNYDGDQIASALQVCSKVKEGTISKDQAVIFLIQFLKMPSEVAWGFFEDDTEALKAKMHPHSVEFKKERLQEEYLADWCIDNGEIMGEEWQEIDDEEVGNEHSQFNFENELNETHHKIHLVKTKASGNVNARGSQDGQSKRVKGALYRVRYYYNSSGYSSNSRAFCRAMMLDAMSGRVYKKEQLTTIGDGGLMGSLSEISANPGWGKFGADNYNIFLYKGGGNCYHRWYRKIYKTTVDDFSYDISAAEVISTTKARSEGFKPEPNDFEVPVAPRDMSGAGFYQNWLREKYG